MTTPLTPPPMPEPAFRLKWKDGMYWVTKPNIEDTDVYTPEQVAARDAQWQARVAELERDTARYRWLRDKGRYNDFSVEQEKPGWVTTHTASTLDAAIDAALSSEGKGAEG